MTEHTNTPHSGTAARYVALIPAAGVGARMAAGSPKQYLAIGAKPMLRHTVDAFLSSPLIHHTYVVVSADDPFIDGVLPDANHGLDNGLDTGLDTGLENTSSRVTVLRCGGATRMESIRNGLRTLHGVLDGADWVLVHDAARPGLDARLIERLIVHTGDHPVGGLLALPVVDTVKRNGPDGVSTVSRDGLWLAQTPQMFRYHLLGRALDAATDPAAITDDASAVEALGLAPKLVEGHPRNLKVTLPSDIRIAGMYLADVQPADVQPADVQPADVQPD